MVVAIDLGSQEEPVHAAHFFMNVKVFRHINKLHHSDERDVHFNSWIIDVQAFCHDNAFKGQIFVHQVMMMQIGQLSKHLKCDLGNVINWEGLLKVAKMIQVIYALVHELVDDINVVMWVKYVEARLNSRWIKTLQLLNLFL